MWAGFNNPLVQVSSVPNRRVLCYSSPKVLACELLCFRVLSVLFTLSSQSLSCLVRYAVVDIFSRALKPLPVLSSLDMIRFAMHSLYLRLLYSISCYVAVLHPTDGLPQTIC